MAEEKFLKLKSDYGYIRLIWISKNLYLVKINTEEIVYRGDLILEVKHRAGFEAMFHGFEFTIKQVSEEISDWYYSVFIIPDIQIEQMVDYHCLVGDLLLDHVLKMPRKEALLF